MQDNCVDCGVFLVASGIAMMKHFKSNVDIVKKCILPQVRFNHLRLRQYNNTYQKGSMLLNYNSSTIIAMRKSMYNDIMNVVSSTSRKHESELPLTAISLISRSDDEEPVSSHKPHISKTVMERASASLSAVHGSGYLYCLLTLSCQCIEHLLLECLIPAEHLLNTC